MNSTQQECKGLAVTCAGSHAQVKTELVLKGLRDGTQGDHPRVILDTFFVPPEQGGLLDPMELER